MKNKVDSLPGLGLSNQELYVNVTCIILRRRITHFCKIRFCYILHLILSYLQP